ncbi:Rrf2 family transcriptional regulator [Bacillus benzoevorans]|uniref:HTH-type transcriptional regulator NsrR n=1 Tax=Bacillus benzoevorans TaxID=1456 RepID=A0A7X0HRE2_9BACI|nr:Rrf2 family transcriptional regulator [Bacillus benzoevorans]MBB6444230.1 Rrf2 family nitric oxide-sensitive transcriptional repressor [Bacillus benzoevorans]
MRLTNYTDYALRVLIYLALKKEEELSTIKEIADTYQISKNHLMKIIHELGLLGYIDTIRGRNGGIRLSMDPEDINIGELVQKTEEDFHLVECFNGDTEKANHCIITPACRLKHILHESLLAFIQVLKGYTLADLIENKAELKELF